MKRTVLPALLLALALCGCAAQTLAETQTTPPPKESAPAAEYDFTILPVQEESIHTLYNQEGYEVRKVTPYEGDYLVEYGYENDPDFALLAWVFGQTGRRVQLAGRSQFTTYEITGPGEVRYTTTGWDAGTAWKGLPEIRTVWVVGDEHGSIHPDQDWGAVQSYQETAWLDPTQPFSMGTSSEAADPPKEWGRYEQLYDARIDADGLSFSFIPNGDSPEKVVSFFPAVTTIPPFSTAFDPEGRIFTIRLYNTCLESGSTEADVDEWLGDYPEDLYPYSFPAGSLGRDSHFLKDVTVAQDGEDVVVSAVLTDRAWRFTVETSNLGRDNIPSFRIVFREYDLEIDKEEVS